MIVQALGEGYSKKKVSFKENSSKCTCEFTVTLAACTRPEQTETRWDPSKEKGR